MLSKPPTKSVSNLFKEIRDAFIILALNAPGLQLQLVWFQSATTVSKSVQNTSRTCRQLVWNRMNEGSFRSKPVKEGRSNRREAPAV